MFVTNPRSLGLALGMGVLTSVFMLPQANAESAYEQEASEMMVQTQVAPQPVIIQQPVVQQPQPIYIPQPVVQQAPRVLSPLPSSEAADVADMTKSELMRRERTRMELKNEDLLNERLEELRLRDERRRTDELVAGQPVGGVDPLNVGSVGLATPAPVATVAMTTVPVGGMAQVQDAGMSMQAVSSTSASIQRDMEEEHTAVYFQPKAGITNFKNVGFFDVRAKYAAGLGIGLSVSNNLSFELGYLFSEFGVAMNSSNPWAYDAQYMSSYYGVNGTFESVSMKQNLLDLGLKVHMLGPSAKLRPFISGGGGYSKSYINADQRIIDLMNQSGIASPDYDLTQFLGYVATGFDIRVNKSISIDITGKYYSVLSSRQNGVIDPSMMYYPGAGGYGAGYPGYSSGYSETDADKQAVGSAFAKTSFYSITGGASFTF